MYNYKTEISYLPFTINASSRYDIVNFSDIDACYDSQELARILNEYVFVFRTFMGQKGKNVGERTFINIHKSNEISRDNKFMKKLGHFHSFKKRLELNEYLTIDTITTNNTVDVAAISNDESGTTKTLLIRINKSACENGFDDVNLAAEFRYKVE